MKKIIKDKQKKIGGIIYFRESLIQSVIADIVTFGFILGGFVLNALVLGGKWYIYLFFMFMAFVSLSSQKKQKRFKNLKEFKEYVANL
jgi:hypothetical protein